MPNATNILVGTSKITPNVPGFPIQTLSFTHGDAATAAIEVVVDFPNAYKKAPQIISLVPKSTVEGDMIASWAVKEVSTTQLILQVQAAVGDANPFDWEALIQGDINA